MNADAAPSDLPPPSLDATPPTPLLPGAAVGPSRRLLLWTLAAVFVLVAARSVDLVRVTTETIDAPYHLMHGLSDWTNYRQGLDVALRYNDPPLGGMLISLPMYLMGCSVGATTAAGFIDTQRLYNGPVLWGQAWDVDTLRYATAVWKSALMLPGLGAAFLWAWRLYGRAAAWLILAALVFDPTVAGFVPQGTLDTPALGMILWSAYLTWRYAMGPTPRRLVWASFSLAVALLTKHTAIMLPFYAVASTLVVWPLVAERQSVRGAVIHAGRLAAAVALTALFIWPLTKFDVSPPIKAYGQDTRVHPVGTKWQDLDELDDWAKHRYPAGVYIGSVLEGQRHNELGHKAYLFGEKYGYGRWDYFPVVALYKVPLGFLALAALGLLSFSWSRPRLAEVPLLILVVMSWYLILSARINIGWRHAMPAAALTLLLACRCAAGFQPRRFRPVLQGMAALLVGWAAVDAALWHPNYVPYLNAIPRDKPYLDISDSNVDFGQAVKQTAWWIDAHRDEVPGPIYLSSFVAHGHMLDRYIGNRAIDLDRRRGLPTTGTLIVSPVNVAGPYEKTDRFVPLRDVEPVAVIGRTMLVYDLSKVPRPDATEPAATR